MNPYLLWVTGVVLIVIAAVLLALNRIETVSAMVAIGVGVSIESVGVWIWMRERQGKGSR